MSAVQGVFQETYLDREELEQTAGTSVYGSAKNVKHGKEEDAFMNFVSATAVRYTVFTNMMTKNGNLGIHTIEVSGRLYSSFVSQIMQPKGCVSNATH